MFKRVYLLIATSCIIISLKAQEPLNLKVSYTMQVNFNSTYQSTSAPTVDCYLYIKDGISKFDMNYEEAEKKYPGELYGYHVSIYKNFNKNEMYGRVIGYKSDEYVIKDSLNIINWKLEDSTKIIKGRSCKLAIAHWRDHDWQAWYDEHITFSDGPYKLNGLPGLILEAKATSCNNVISTFEVNDIQFTNDSFAKEIFFPFAKKEFKFINYAVWYPELAKTMINNLKNSYLRSQESANENNVISGKTCSSSISFDFCFCYP